MRLGQLARKYNVSQDDVILYLNEVQTELSPFHHNSKLSDEIEDLVISHFSLSIEEVDEVIEEQSIDISTEVDEQILDVAEIDRDKEIEALMQQELDPTLPPIQISETKPEPEPEPTKKEEIAIDTDSLLELLESEEEIPDLSNITHIKASKKELSGLKVVGKIELAEPIIKPAEKSEIEEEVKPERNDRQERQRLYDEEREKRRLKAKEKKEQYEARQEKRRIEEEKKQKKAQNKARYEQKMQQVKASQSKQKIQKEDEIIEASDLELPSKPTSLLGKFWAWLKA